MPDDRAIVVERFRDELGDWRVAILSPFGAQVHAPWALAVSARMRDRFGVDVQAMHGDDGIVLRLPDIELDELDGVRERGVGRELLDLVTLDPDDVRGLVTDEIGGSALFAARFRECAARALLLPRRRPDRRQPLWQQRQRASQLLEVASQYPTFPIVLEAVRECVQDVFDVPGLVDLMRDIGSRRVTVVDVESSTPSPFAKSLLFGYVAQFLYEGDSPLAERRAAALALDPSLLAELLGTSEGLALRDLLDAEQIARTEAELQRLTPERAARDADDVLDLLRSLGPLPVDGILARCREGTTGDDVEAWLAGLHDARQVIAVRVAGRGPVVGHRRRLPAARRAGRLAAPRRAAGVPRAGRRPARRPRGPLRPHPRAVPRRRGGPRLRARAPPWPPPPCARLVSSGRVVEGELLPTGGGGTEFCDAEVLRCCAAARSPRCAPRSSRSPRSSCPASCRAGRASAAGCAGVTAWSASSSSSAGRCCRPAPSSPSCCPTRVADYSPALLDELMATGEVLWCGHGSLPGDDGWVSLHLADSAHVTLPGPDPDRVPSAEGLAVLDALAGGGAHFFRTLSDQVGSTDDQALATTLWDLAWSGRVTGDTFAPVRALLSGGRTAHQRSASGPRRTRYAGRRGPLGGLGAAPTRARRSRPAPAPRRSPAAGRCCPRSTSTPPCGPTPPPSCCSTGTASSPGGRPPPRTCRRLRRDLPGARPGRGGRAGAPRRRSPPG